LIESAPSAWRVYHEESGIRIYHGDSREILPTLGKFDLLLTDPPYGIHQDRGMGDGGFGFGRKRMPKSYAGGWDEKTPDLQLMLLCLDACRSHIVWGGNYLSSLLPQQPKWLVWDKEQTMPSYSDAELAWTTLPGVSVKMMRYNGSGLLAKEKQRDHPTQKPLNLMLWCLQIAGPEVQTVLDPFAGSGTTGRACKDLGKKCVLIERDERFCEIAARRLAQEVLPL
jgi:DNA modification methylase